MTRAYLDTFDKISNSYERLNNNIQRICIYSDNPLLVCDNYYLYPQDESFKQSSGYRALFQDAKIAVALFEEKGQIAYYRIMNYRKSDFQYPVLKIKIKNQEFYEPLQGNGANNNVFLFYTNGSSLQMDGNSTKMDTVLPLLPEIMAQDEGILGKISFNNDIVLFTTTKLGWKIVKVIDPATFFQKALGIRKRKLPIYACIWILKKN
ncbi:MAG: hypothetical protein VB070_06195 [Clostridiaceae bacterium]|nr:hypothetical protein [Clostridiaceae bacterium]